MGEKVLGNNMLHTEKRNRAIFIPTQIKFF